MQPIMGIQFENLDQEAYDWLIHDHVVCEEVQANSYESNPTTPSVAYKSSIPPSTQLPATQLQVPVPSMPDAPPALTGVPLSAPPNVQSRFASMAIITPSPPIHGSTTATHMDSGPNMLLHQLMFNASACSTNCSGLSHFGNSVSTTFNRGQYQVW